MRLRLFYAIILIGLMACQSGVSEENSEIGQLKKALSENPSKENRSALMKAYRAAISANPEATTANAMYYQELAKLQVENKEFVLALQTLMQAIQTYPQAKTTSDNVWQLAQVYRQHIQRPQVAQLIQKMYARRFPDAANAAAAEKILAESNTDIGEDIAALGNSMYDETTHKVDFQAANDYIRVCELYALLNPQNGQSPEYLHKAGETARAVRAFPKAVAIYDKIYNKYPTYEKAPQALFLKAFTYDNDLNDKATAKSLYETFLQKYPTDDFADDTEFLLKNLGKDDEEIIKSFSEKK